MKALLLGIASLFLVACTTPIGIATKYVQHVCDLSPVERELLREHADVATFPHKVRVECNGL